MLPFIHCRMSPYRDAAYLEIVTGRNRSKSILQQHRIISIDEICRYLVMQGQK